MLDVENNQEDPESEEKKSNKKFDKLVRVLLTQQVNIRVSVSIVGFIFAQLLEKWVFCKNLPIKNADDPVFNFNF